jgi:predicted RNA binding protein YcfA (HicA-like mRNA interferase family)
VSQRLPALEPKDVMRVLRRAGFKLHHLRGSHYVFKHAQTGQRVIAPHHDKDLKKRHIDLDHRAGWHIDH